MSSPRPFGLHDDSFGYSTLDGQPNGGEEVAWWVSPVRCVPGEGVGAAHRFFWPSVLQAGAGQAWRGVASPRITPTQA